MSNVWLSYSWSFIILCFCLPYILYIFYLSVFNFKLDTWSTFSQIFLTSLKFISLIVLYSLFVLIIYFRVSVSYWQPLWLQPGCPTLAKQSGRTSVGMNLEHPVMMSRNLTLQLFMIHTVIQSMMRNAIQSMILR